MGKLQITCRVVPGEEVRGQGQDLIAQSCARTSLEEIWLKNGLDLENRHGERERDTKSTESTRESEIA